MAKKSFKEVMEQVAENSRTMNKKYPPPKTKVDTRGVSDAQPGGPDAFATRPGRIRGPNSGKDVNLPLEKKKFPGRGFGSRVLKD